MKERITLALGLVFASFNATATIYKCEIDGVATFSESPCGAQATVHQQSSHTRTPVPAKASGVTRALMWQKEGIKTCTLYQTPEQAKSDFDMAQKMASALASKLPKDAESKWKDAMNSLHSVRVQERCDTGAAAKCHDYAVIFNGIVEEHYYTSDGARLKGLEKKCTGGGAQFTTLK